METDLQSLNEVFASNKPSQYVFTFFSKITHSNPEVLPSIINWILRLSFADRRTVLQNIITFLLKLSKRIRKAFFLPHIFPLWRMLFYEMKLELDAQKKLKLIHEFNRELPLQWTIEYIINDPNFFYYEDLNSVSSPLILNILIDLMERCRKDSKTSTSADSVDWKEELRLSGILEKIGSLWPLILQQDNENTTNLKLVLKALALASSISTTNSLFHDLDNLLIALNSSLVKSDAKEIVWILRLADTIVRRTPKRIYVLSHSRAELATISKPLIEIISTALNLPRTDNETMTYKASLASLIQGIMERWEALACPLEIEADFIAALQTYLDRSYYDDSGENDDYKIMNSLLLTTTSSFNFGTLLISFFRNILRLTAIHHQHHMKILIKFSRYLVLDEGTDRSFPLLFRHFPGLVEDIYQIIERDKMLTLEWLSILTESGRTREPLLSFILDPKQIERLFYGKSWIDLMGKFVESEKSYHKIDNWTEGGLSRRLLQEILSLNESDDQKYSCVLLKCALQENTIQSIPNTASFLKRTTSDLELFKTLLELCNVEELRGHLPEIIPFLSDSDSDSDETAKILFLKHQPTMKLEVLLKKLFDFESGFQERRIAAAEWKLFILVEKEKSSFEIEIAHMKTEDYSKYLTDLFTSISQHEQQEQQQSLVSDSKDPVEMFLNYWKFGQIRAARTLIPTLLSERRKSELLLRIPLSILVETADFGQSILVDLFKVGWSEKDVSIVQSMLEKKKFLEIRYKIF